MVLTVKYNWASWALRKFTEGSLVSYQFNTSDTWHSAQLNCELIPHLQLSCCSRIERWIVLHRENWGGSTNLYFCRWTSKMDTQETSASFSARRNIGIIRDPRRLNGSHSITVRMILKGHTTTKDNFFVTNIWTILSQYSKLVN
jgi:hypothetical protein